MSETDTEPQLPKAVWRTGTFIAVQVTQRFRTAHKEAMRLSRFGSHLISTSLANDRAHAVNGHEIDVAAAAAFQIGKVNAHATEIQCAQCFQRNR